MTPQTEITRWSDLTSDQQQAMLTLLEKMEQGQSLLSLSGHAGTGKTTALRVLVDLLVDREIIPVVVTPTNKAATVLQRKGVSAATVFARFFTLEEVSRRPKKMTFVPNYQLEKLGAGKISQADVVIVDEGSMLNSWVLKHLQKMADILILVGDGAQLPPVGDIDNPLCCNPAHLSLGTQKENMSDMVAQGKQRKGKDVPGAKLNPEKVQEIRERVAAGESRASVSQEFNVCVTNVTNIVNRKIWRHVA